MAHNGPRDWANIKQAQSFSTWRQTGHTYYVVGYLVHSNKPQPIKIRVIGRNLNRNQSINDEEEEKFRTGGRSFSL